MSWDKSKFKTYDTSNGYGSERKWRNSFYERISDQEASRIIREQDETPYSLLNILEGATQAEIKTAFRTKMKEWHPDFNPHRIDEATAMSKKIIAAYTILKK